MTQVYLSAPLPAVTTKLLDQAGLTYSTYSGPGLIDQATLKAAVADCEVLITPLSTQVDATVIDAAPKLKLIANFGAGFNNIDGAAARKRGIAVTNTPFVSSTSTAELACGLIIALSRRIVEGDHLMRTTGFAGWAPLFFLGHQLAGKTLGIIGMGSIGREVAKRLHAFKMKIIYTQRHPLDPAVEAECAASFCSQEALLKEADVVTIHAPLTPSTHHLLGAPEFKAMKETALLINCARGPIIDEEALLEALQKHELAGAALDVYEHEPQVAAGFKELQSVILTPHIGNATVEARDAMGAIVAKNAIRVIQGTAPQYVVN